MKLFRQGMYRNHGATKLVSEDDDLTLRQADTGVLVLSRSARYDQASYWYKLYLSPEDVLRCLFTLDKAKIAEAIGELQSEFNLQSELPNVLSEMLKGAIPAPPPDEDDDESDD